MLQTMTTLTGARLESAKQAYNEYAKSANNDPAIISFFEGVQWADCNPTTQWHKVENTNECIALMAAYFRNGYVMAVINKSGVGDIADNLAYAMTYTYWMVLPKLPE